MVEEKVTEAIIDVGKNVAEDIVRPTSKSIGENLGLLVDGVMGWLGYWGQKQEIKREAYLADFKKKIAEKVAGIPEEKLNEPKIRIVGPAIEASKFYIEEAEFRELFAELVASACDADCVNKVHPAFPEMIKQLSYLDIKLLEVFRQTHTLPCCTINETHKDGKVTPYPHIMFDFKGVKHMPYLNEEIIYSLRNCLLHQSTPNVEQSKIHESRRKVDKFELVITGEDGANGDLSMVAYGKDMNIVRRELKVHISHLCYILCTAAEDYYKNNKEKFDFIKYSIEDDRPKTFL